MLAIHQQAGAPGAARERGFVAAAHGEVPEWSPQVPRFRPLQLVVGWITAAIGVFVAAAVVPGVSVGGFWGAIAAAALVAIVNAVLPPIVAALRLPFTLLIGFVVVLAVDGVALRLVSHIAPDALEVKSFGWALVAAVIISAATLGLQVVLGVDDDDTYTVRVIQRIARRQGGKHAGTVPGIVFLEIDGLALPVLQHAMREGSAPEMARWLESGEYQLEEWEPDLSSQTGASQAGILLGCNDEIPAFRWLDRLTRKVVACSSPQDCAAIEARLATGDGLLAAGGTSRGNLFSGEADEVILTVSRMDAEKRANRGYRSFLANGFNVTRLLVLFTWEVILERVAAIRQRRRGVWPRGERGGRYPLLRASLCVGVRELITFGVLSDMMRGVPAIYATFSSYDEVAHHSGLERPDTLEALRKLDQQFGRIARARRYAPRPYVLVVLSDHGQTQGATFKQRNGYDLQEFVERSLSQGRVDRAGEGDENHAAVDHALQEASGRRPPGVTATPAVSGEVTVLASGNLGLIYLTDARERVCVEEIDARHPDLLPALRQHPHIGFILVRSRSQGPVVMGARGLRYLNDDAVEGEDPLASFPAGAAHHLRRTDGFRNAPDVLVNSFYDASLEQGCAFEELISFHGGLGGPQTRPFILHPGTLPMPDHPLIGAAAVHEVLVGWRRLLTGTYDGGPGSPSSCTTDKTSNPAATPTSP